MVVTNAGREVLKSGDLRSTVHKVLFIDFIHETSILINTRHLEFDISEVNGPTSPASIQNKASENMLSVLIISLPAVQTVSAGEYPAHETIGQWWVDGVHTATLSP